MYILNKATELDVITIVNIYLIIGIIITILMYEKLVKRLAKEIEDKAYLYSSISSNNIDNFIKYSPLVLIIMWPIVVIGFIIGAIEGIIKFINDNYDDLK